ncbi:MAG: hypothetical protein SH868_12620 [Bythopirellula sp.]|nr:hypothetical protein [Bythopirellula sp.]
MKFAHWVFLLAGIYGVAVVLPQFFLENQVGRDFPPAITHPEYFYGFAGVALAWQVAFLIIARDPARYRPIMLAAILEKASFGFATIALFLEERLALQMLLFGLIDLVWGVLFLVAWWKIRSVN